MMMKKLCLFGLAAVSFICAAPESAISAAPTAEWDKVFKKSDNVNVEKVTFKNRYGIELAGDLYTPKINLQRN